MPTAGSPPIGYASTGVTTVVWGTQGLAVFQGTEGADINIANNGYFILTDYKQRLKKDLDYGENGSGVECRRTTIIHGQHWDITVEDNSNMTPPAQNTTITCYDILQKGLGGPIAAKAVWTAVIIESEYTAAPKRPGMRTLTAENLTLVDSQS
jgi:hypothetical protein